MLDDSWSVGRAEAFEHTGRGKLLGDELGVSEGRGACQAADCRREKQERERGLTTGRGETEHR